MFYCIGVVFSCTSTDTTLGLSHINAGVCSTDQTATVGTGQANRSTDTWPWNCHSYRSHRLFLLLLERGEPLWKRGNKWSLCSDSLSRFLSRLGLIFFLRGDGLHSIQAQNRIVGGWWLLSDDDDDGPHVLFVPWSKMWTSASFMCRCTTESYAVVALPCCGMAVWFLLCRGPSIPCCTWLYTCFIHVFSLCLGVLALGPTFRTLPRRVSPNSHLSSVTW